MFNERRNVKRTLLPDGKWLAWTQVDLIDGQGQVFSTSRDLFTLNYEPIPNARGEALLKGS